MFEPVSSEIAISEKWSVYYFWILTENIKQSCQVELIRTAKLVEMDECVDVSLRQAPLD